MAGRFFSYFCSNPGFTLEIPHEEHSDTPRNGECKRKSPPYILHSVDYVHTQQAGYQCGEHEYDADAGEHLHHSAHVVVDDVGVCVHGGIEDVGVDVGGLTRLAHLNVDVLNHVGIQFVDGKFELQLRQEVLVATYGCDEIREAVLQPTQWI